VVGGDVDEGVTGHELDLTEGAVGDAAFVIHHADDVTGGDAVFLPDVEEEGFHVLITGVGAAASFVALGAVATNGLPFVPSATVAAFTSAASVTAISSVATVAASAADALFFLFRFGEEVGVVFGDEFRSASAIGFVEKVEEGVGNVGGGVALTEKAVELLGVVGLFLVLFRGLSFVEFFAEARGIFCLI